MNCFIGVQALRSMLVLVVLASLALSGTSQAAQEKWQLAMNNAELRVIV